MISSLLTPIITIKYIPADVPFGCGLSYIKTLLSLIPNINNYISMSEVQYVSLIPFNWNALGGSWIGEIFYNFGWLGTIFSFGIGAFLSKIDNVLTKESNNYFLNLMVFPFLFCSIKYVREYFYIFRLGIIQLILIVIIWMFIYWFKEKNICKKILNMLERSS